MKQILHLSREALIPLPYQPNKSLQLTRLLVLGIIFTVISPIVHAQSTRVSIDAHNISVSEILKMIESKSDYHFAYNNKLIDVTRKVDLNASNEKVSDILKHIFANTDVTFTLVDKQIVLSDSKVMNSINSTQTAGKISGSVTDENGVPIIGASVVVKGSGKGTITDVNGYYTLEVPSHATVQFSYIGSESKEVTVGRNPVIDVQLKESVKALNEVVVTALGIKRDQKGLGYAMKEMKGDELSSQVINPVAALQGKVAGVEIAQSDGGMFGSVKIQIRGASTLGNNNQPIYVVDGIIMDNSVSNSGDADWNTNASDYGNELKNLNPDDFATISVLKGAAATALYGSRGLHGAVVITTKDGKGKKGLGISFSQTVGVDYVYAQPKFQNEYGDGVMAGYVNYGQTDANGNYYAFDNQNQFMLNSTGKHTLIGNGAGTGYGPAFDGSSIEYYDHTYQPYVADKNNYMDCYNLGFNTNTNIAITGGNDKTTFYNSLSYRYNTGTLPNNSFSRLSLLTKASQKISNQVTLEASVAFVNSMPKNAQPNLGDNFTSGSSNYGIFSRSYNPNILKNLYKGASGGVADDTYGDTYGDVPGHDLWWAIYQNNIYHKETEVRPTLTLNATLTDWLKFSTEGNFNYYYNRNEDQEPGTGYANQGGYYGTGLYTKEQTNLNASFIADKTVGNWNFGGFLRSEFYDKFEETASANTNGGLIVHNQYFIANSVSTPSYTTAISGQKRMYSIAGQARASWKDQVFMDVTGRNDWSSALVYSDGHGNYSYFYPSISGSWLVNNTVKLPSWVSFMKVRGSWAQVGNDTDPYLINSAYTLGTSNTVNGPVYSLSLPSTVYSQNLKPERKNAWEVGLDWRFLSSRINLDATYYKENTYDQIMNVTAPAESGISSQFINAGNIQNKGVEIALNTIPLKGKDWEWSVDLTYSKNANKVIALSPLVANYIDLSGTENYGNYRIASVAKVGAEYGMLMTDSKAAIDPTTGLPMLTYSNTRRGAYYQRSGQVQALGSMMPDFLGSVATGFKYKSFTLHASFDMRFGGYVASYGSRYGTADGYTNASLQYSSPNFGGMIWTSKWDDKTYRDGMIPNGIIAAGTQIAEPDGSTYTVATGGETYRSLYAKGKVEPVHASYWNYRINSWSTGVINDDWVKKLNYIAFRELSLSYVVPKEFAKKLGATGLNVSLSGRNLGYLLNSMPNGENPESVRGTQTGEFRVRSFSCFTASYAFTINASF
jgi:iron complex outermembrane receptor protein